MFGLDDAIDAIAAARASARSRGVGPLDLAGLSADPTSSDEFVALPSRLDTAR
jgi:hypothetical protein